tara:strand:+ start:41285 stop:41983 length:699 start_codon:yes stop_codon:yes gene_type:complete
MKIKTSLPIFWLPIVSYWTFLIVLQTNYKLDTIDGLIPLITYFVVSFLFMVQLQFVLINKKKNFIFKLGSSNLILSSLLFSSLIIFIRYFINLPEVWANSLLLISLITNTIISELWSFSNEGVSKGIRSLRSRKANWKETSLKLQLEQDEKLKLNDEKRNVDLSYRKQWEEYLEKASLEYLDNTEINFEINRLKEILEYSSFFRLESSLKTLYNIKKSSDNNIILAILKTIK